MSQRIYANGKIHNRLSIAFKKLSEVQLSIYCGKVYSKVDKTTSISFNTNLMVIGNFEPPL